MSRKYSHSGQKYPPPFSMRFTEDEREALELAAAGRPLAAYIRSTLNQKFKKGKYYATFTM